MLSKTIVILGPTCTGKTSLGLKLCKMFNGVIVSADSRQVVRYMDIGTGKVPAGGGVNALERRKDRCVLEGVDVFGYDLVNPDEYFSAYDYLRYCQEIFPRVSLNGKRVFLVGGTGFYIDAVTGTASLQGGGPDMDLRRSLEGLSAEELSKKLFELDKVAYKNIDLKNSVRLIRAVEKATHKTSLTSGTRLEKLVEPAYIGLTADREVLYKRSDAWVEGIFGEKLFEEVKMIQTRFPKSHRLKGLIYKSVADYLSGDTGLEDCKQRVKFDMHAYIRRQQTWFKRKVGINWLNICDPNFDSIAVSIVESVVNG